MPTGTVQTEVLTVTAYSARLGRALRTVGGAVIEGEVQKPKKSGSGALWFSLTDGEAVLPCKVFPSQVRALQHAPREGDLVQAEVERPDLWAQAGKLDLIVSQIRLAGEGELLRRRQELIARLSQEGLCDPTRRRRLPRFPRAVGVIAGTNSDAMSDVVQALTDRWPSVHIVTCASLVQGKRAPRDLIDALARMTEHPLVDVVVMARGGGSVQDLACFDDEGLCRALFACELPVVCAIGHTDNNPVCNHVAWPAYTPSRSAELVVPCAAELLHDIAAARGCLDDVPGHLVLIAERVERTVERLNCAAALDARARLVRECAGQVQGTLEDSWPAMNTAYSKPGAHSPRPRIARPGSSPPSERDCRRWPPHSPAPASASIGSWSMSAHLASGCVPERGGKPMTTLATTAERSTGSCARLARASAAARPERASLSAARASGSASACTGDSVTLSVTPSTLARSSPPMTSDPAAGCWPRSTTARRCARPPTCAPGNA